MCVCVCVLSCFSARFLCECVALCFSNCEKPRLIEALRSKRVRDIACGSSHSAAIISSGDLFTWGLGDYGRLGHGDNATQLRPKQVLLQYTLLTSVNSLSIMDEFQRNNLHLSPVSSSSFLLWLLTFFLVAVVDLVYICYCRDYEVLESSGISWTICK